MESVIAINRNRVFSLEEVRQILPIIYRMTEEACSEVRRHLNRIDAYADKSHPSVSLIEEHINLIIDRWQAKIEKLGGEPKGLWMADFDNGEGYFCWKYPEVEIDHWHGYQDGFSGRVNIK